ncbi:unnamed protein product [Chilo suppressalis]|uniref:Aminopeptidase n=1 Tax=Chilo suppressalis TaxID=168631 RepID=A0ABN8EBL2_CHISP|nr:unnamed protein product [Chilo suppressalis]
MATVLGFIVLTAACLAADAFPDKPLPYRNTIFGDEKLEGEVFEEVDAFNSITLYNTADNPYRLPRTTFPVHYNVDWTINLPDPRNFSGTVKIYLQASSYFNNEIVLHAHDLNINSVKLELNSEEVVQTYTVEPEFHFLRIRPVAGPLLYNWTIPITYELTIDFEAPLRDDMYGIYQSWFRNNYTDAESWMASTQFQATAARFAFPCYDEPSFKATFNISITRPANYHSWSCTRQQMTVDSDLPGYQTDIYYPTPIMSTYLIALIVAEYQSEPVNGTNPETNEEVLQYEVIARPGAMREGQGEYALEMGQDLLAEMSNHTDMDFFGVHQYIKMTQAAIPDFGAGAMENWGLLTYREAYLMYDENHTNGYFKQLIAYILSHEIAHMWFGNLVTCDWWDSLWLNEGFARYYQYFLTHWVDPNLGLGSRFIPEQVHTALLSDSSDNPHPLTNPGVGSTSAVSAMFSTISYNKGAAIIRMTEHLMGSDNHRHGLRKYLRNREFQTARPIDLFEDLGESANESGALAAYGPEFNIVDYYKTWTEQGGHPVLNVAVNHQTGIMTVSQRRFNINSGYSTASSNWIIPVTFATASNPDFEDTKPTHIISGTLAFIDRNSTGDEWVVFNKQQTGFYRVNYDDYTWDLIVMALRGPNRTSIHEYNRAQIVNDVFQFARSGLMNYTRAFNILSFLQNEDAYTPWVAAITGFNWINNRVIGTPIESRLNQMFMGWASNVMGQLTYDVPANETFMRSYLRYQLAPVMCRLGNNECLQAATEQFTNLTQNGQEVAVDNRNWVYCNALRQGGWSEFEYLSNRFLQHNVYTEKIQILMILGCTKNATALNLFLDDIVEENFIIRKQDYNTAFNSALTGNEENTAIVFEYIQNNTAAVIDAFGSLASRLSAVASRLRTPEKVREFREWATNNQALLGAEFQAVYNAAESSISAIEWADDNLEDFDNYLNVGDQPLTSSTPAPIITTPPWTMTVPNIQAPTTPDLPDLPDSANTSFLSFIAISFALIVKFIF